VAKSKPPMNNMMRQVQQMQEQMVAAQAALAEMTVEASAGGGMVKATVTGTGELVAIELAPEVVDPDDIEMLQDLIVAAVTEANREAQARQSESMGAATGGIDLSAFGLG
jgi:DNA-binding YbaB/EbfC family protein